MIIIDLLLDSALSKLFDLLVSDLVARLYGLLDISLKVIHVMLESPEEWNWHSYTKGYLLAVLYKRGLKRQHLRDLEN